MNGGNHNNTRGTRRPGNHAGHGARPDPDRGSIVSGSRAQEIRRRRKQRHNSGGYRDPQVGRSLVGRVTVGQGGHGRGQIGRALADRILTYDGGGGGAASGPIRDAAQGTIHRHDSHHPMGSAADQVHARTLIDRNTVGTSGGRGTAQATNYNVLASSDSQPDTKHSLFVSTQPTQVPRQSDFQMSAFSFDPLFDEPAATPLLQARARVNDSARTTFTTINNKPQEEIRPRPKPRTGRVAKDPVDHIENPKLRALLSGRKPREYKRGDAMLLRMGHTSKGMQGHELVCRSPIHEQSDDEM